MSADYGDNRPDLSAFWMPFTANRQYKDAPRLLVEASGMHYRTLDGDSVLDGTAGLWCCNLGHAREEITQAVSRQLATLDFAPTFQMGHPLPFRLAAALAEVAPPGLDRIKLIQGNHLQQRRIYAFYIEFCGDPTRWHIEERQCSCSFLYGWETAKEFVGV